MPQPARFEHIALNVQDPIAVADWYCGHLNMKVTLSGPAPVSVRFVSDEAGHMMEDGHCVRTIHAEVNAVIQAAKNGTRIEGATIYVTASPCWNCFKTICNAGIKRIVFEEFYRDERIFEVSQVLGIELVELHRELDRVEAAP